ncbi:NnrU family protein [Oceaniglobus indicus]|uniref:NnrU family protein n=1 Tax=Oceaniglobus indicus TaxID=2047749 RepID=UPI000C19EE79|nr:NnrU family protein [Oceaniglobus indicus]
MTGWGGFALAVAVFFVTHSVPVRPPVKARLVAVLGRRGFTLAYSALSLAALTWVIVAAGRAPYVALWDRAPWQTWVPLIAMALACGLICFAIARPNPLSFGGVRNDRFDPSHPGIVRWVRHPLLVAMALWALAHLVVNGDLAHVILFGIFAAFALLGRLIVDRRNIREMGAARHAALCAAIKAGPVIPQPTSWTGAAVRGAVAVALYVGLLWAHPVVIGVSPLAF